MTKRLLSLVAAAAALVALTPLAVTTSAAEMTCRIPFDFAVDGAAFPAGSYMIGNTSGVLYLRGAYKGAFLSTAPTSGASDRSGRGKVVFLKTGDRYDLAEIWSSDGLGHLVRPS